MKTLRPFQETVIDELRTGFIQGHKRQLLALATGAGKTVVASHLIHRAAEKDCKSLFIVDRIELVDQAVRHLSDIGLQVGVYQGDNTQVQASDEVVVASIQTIRSRGAIPSGFVIIDEAHILHQAHIDLMKQWDNVPIIGLSATPLRDDLGKYFSNLVRGPSIQWLIENNYLTSCRAFCPTASALEKALDTVKTRAGDFAENELSTALNRKELIGDIVTTWKEKGENRPTLVFAVDIAHSKAITQEFQTEQIETAHIDAYTKSEERAEIVDAFKAGEIQVLSSVNVLGIGFDAPEASCAVLARPTLSEALHMQQIGRVIRPAENKSDAVILDHSGNTIRFGLPQHFEVPDLGSDKRQTANKTRKQKRMVTCSSCGAVMDPGQQTCAACGIDRPIKNTEVHQVDGELIEYGSEKTGTKQYSVTTKRKWYKAFLWYSQHHNYSKGWAYHKYMAKFSEKPAWKWQRLNPEPPTAEMSRWIKSQNIRWAKTRHKSKPINHCKHCGSTDLKKLPGKGPHASGIGCTSCGKHLGWISKKSA
ncbi:MAG: DEAD/DEAH box helicase [Candidatus Thiodiazotropha sp. (ex Lucinoma borealis)]|nr:DEAD/DEAH box helicase [Candidatus Thiodiazotropha sp. (ex Lucinoma borealis)]MCU7868239.1 DEAD/DEAH box helicase [Candidatus Thiodiazotropha sp. (ex Lucinoma borealis)]